jgi:hypothetical protein
MLNLADVLLAEVAQGVFACVKYNLPQPSQVEDSG